MTATWNGPALFFQFVLWKNFLPKGSFFGSLQISMYLSNVACSLAAGMPISLATSSTVSNFFISPRPT